MIVASTKLLAVLAIGCLVGCGRSPEAQRGDSAAATPVRSPPVPHGVSSSAPSSSAPIPSPSDSCVSFKTSAPVRSIDEMLLFFPTQYPDGDWNPEGLQTEDIWFNAQDGTRLHGWYCPCEKARAVVLFLHGNAGNLSYRANRIAALQSDLRVTTFIFDYRGYGRSEGQPTVDGVLQDARAARKTLASRAGIDESQIVLLGESLGGAVAVSLASDKGARGLVLESTFSSLADVAAYHYPQLAWLVPTGKLDSVAIIGRYPGPLLQCHGDADATIPFASGEKLFTAAAGKKQFVRIPGGDHNDPLPASYFEQLNAFVKDLPQP